MLDSRQLEEGQRVVGVPWPSAEGEGTWQQYVNVPLENLVCHSFCLVKTATCTAAIALPSSCANFGGPFQQCVIMLSST